MYAPSTSEKLKNLGDPSGQQNAKYWDEWFDIVCKEQNHQPFEWYTGVEEVARVLKHHLPGKNGGDSVGDKLLGMCHPGSGTSLLPLKLQKDFPNHRQFVIDISEVALDEMRQVHETQHISENLSLAATTANIEYMPADILNPPMKAIEDSSCEAWIDKGFIDAVFCSPEKGGNSDKEHQEKQAQALFVETNRVLCHDGIALIVSLVEDHSLQIIVQNWIHLNNNNGNYGWNLCLHVWEMHPLSGTLRPFGFVLTKYSSNQPGSSSSDTTTRKLILHRRADNVEEDISLPERETDIFQVIKEQIQQFRARYENELKQKHRGDEDSDPTDERQKVLVTLELKPCDVGGDLEALASAIQSVRWKSSSQGQLFLNPKWHPFRLLDNKNEEHERKPSFTKIIPIGFGISKLLMQCIIASDYLDDLVMELEEWGESNEAKKYGGIGSVDIESTVPVSDAMDLFSKNRNKK